MKPVVCLHPASESTRLRMEESLPNHHEDHKFIPMPQAMKIPAAKAAMGKIGEKFGVEPDESQT